MIRVVKTASGFERELLAAPFGFKGGYLTELWQTAVKLVGDDGSAGLGLGIQSILWADPGVFSRYSELHGNTLMHQITRHAVTLVKGEAFRTPLDLLEGLFPETLEYGRRLLDDPQLRPTFILNALSAIDQAAWVLYARTYGLGTFAGLLPDECAGLMESAHHSVAAVPLVPYGMTEPGIRELTAHGYGILKIKLGADPLENGDKEQMLQWDRERLSQVHRIAGEGRSSLWPDGRVRYILDANGGYDSRDTLLRLLEHADRIGALERTILFEEPFADPDRESAEGLPVPLAADESVWNSGDAVTRLQQGYSVVVLQPAAKTLGMSLKIAAAVLSRGGFCYCGDLTVNPAMAEWNKNLAAHLPPLPGMRMGMVETNGPQHYLNWARMREFHPVPEADWIDVREGRFELGHEFAACAGGIFAEHPHYAALAR